MASIKYRSVYIADYSTIIGPKEKISKLKNYDFNLNDYYFDENTFELAEVKMQRVIIDNLLKKNKLKDSNIDLLLGGDLTNQISITNMCGEQFDIPFLGLYNACATFAESLIVGASFLDNLTKYNNILTITSSHNLTAEKQFRFPIEYGSPRKLTSTFTTTGGVATLLTKLKGKIKIESSTIGRIVDLGITDANNMGAAMAPAAASTLINHLTDLKRKPEYYDLILTGDLGCVGKNIFEKYLEKNYYLNLKNYLDAGCEIYPKKEEFGSGGSGPVCLPLVLFNKILPNKKYKKILIIATGALHSPILVNQKNSIPAIAHAVSLEVLE